MTGRYGQNLSSARRCSISGAPSAPFTTPDISAVAWFFPCARVFMHNVGASTTSERAATEPRGHTHASCTPYQRARMRYFSTEVPFAATGTLNCAAHAAVFVYL